MTATKADNIRRAEDLLALIEAGIEATADIERRYDLMAARDHVQTAIRLLKADDDRAGSFLMACKAVLERMKGASA